MRPLPARAWFIVSRSGPVSPATASKGPKVVIQGFGQVGSWVARLIGGLGCTVAGVSTVAGGVYNPGGLDISKLLDYSKVQGTVVGFPDADAVGPEEFLELPCDILVPAAIEGVIHTRNADRIKARVIVGSGQPSHHTSGLRLDAGPWGYLPARHPG